jgi:hypothetical protein
MNPIVDVSVTGQWRSCGLYCLNSKAELKLKVVDESSLAPFNSGSQSS